MDAVMVVRTSTHDVVASQCSDVLLDCQFVPDVMPINFGILFVTWKFQGQNVAVFDEKVENKWSTAQLFPEELKKGNASLLLRRVEKSMEGQYVCEVLYAPDKESVKPTLKVTGQGKDCSHPSLSMDSRRQGEHNGIGRSEGERTVLAFVGMLLALLLQ
ncbi:uncharacterized protein LOC122813985 isoform X2 [Protopterus annectens]|uniref:uncharacterized protein LOC122813985 isoform X2 n=1 Tax=Protopterus annectens TaxID=7888 RepID=UPI001CFB4DB6|nr:uncharacterized protein LOC122813985 isoform X2 [Protopterus annectens]